MKMTRTFPLIVAVAIGLTACEDGLGSNSLLSDDELTNDVAASSGDAIATSIDVLIANQTLSGLPQSSVQSGVAAANTSNLTFSRTRTCFSASDSEIPCNNLANVRKIVTHVTVDGSRSGDHTTRDGGTATWSGTVQRVLDDTLVRVFNTEQPPAETSRIHSGVGTGTDNTEFTSGDLSREATETFTDSVKAITFNLPRSSNPWPVSGSTKRVVAVHVTVTRGSDTQTRDVTRTVEVIFPADAQGNVTLHINDKTCQLNLVTHAVTNCQ